MMAWPFLEKTIKLTFGGTLTTPTNLPSDFHQVVAMQPPQSSSTTCGYGRPTHMRYDEFLRYNPDSTLTGIPYNFYFDTGGNLNFFPIPTSDSTVFLSYISTPAALTAATLEASIVIPKQFQRDTLVNGALYRLDAMNDDTDIAAWFQVEYQNTLQRMQDWVTRRQWQDVDIIRPMPGDVYGDDNSFGLWGSGGSNF